MSPVCMVCMTPKVRIAEEAHHSSWECQSDICRQYAEMPHREVKLAFKPVPGGYDEANRSNDYKFRQDFDPGIEAYKKARAEGLKPKGTTTKKVKEAYETVKSQERALKKAKKMGMETETLKTVPGVER